MTEQTSQTAPENAPPADTSTITGAQPTDVAAQNQANAPSTIQTQEDLHQVMVDQWGHRGEFTRGQILSLSDISRDHYDIDHAIRMGVLRPLTQAEARPGSLPTTTPLNDLGEVDEDHRRAMQFAAGVTSEAPRTVTTVGGPAEPAEFAKPTIAFTGTDQPAARPVVVVDTALEAETEGTRATRIVPTTAGPAFANAEDQQQANGGRRGRSASRSNEEG